MGDLLDRIREIARRGFFKVPDDAPKDGRFRPRSASVINAADLIKPPVTIDRKSAVEIGVSLDDWTPDPVRDRYTR